MRDRLRAVNCPSDMIDQIGGLSSGEVGDGYGEGHSLVKDLEWLRKINKPPNYLLYLMNGVRVAILS